MSYKSSLCVLVTGRLSSTYIMKCKGLPLYIFIYLFLYSSEDQTQCLPRMTQALYHCATTPARLYIFLKTSIEEYILNFDGVTFINF